MCCTTSSASRSPIPSRPRSWPTGSALAGLIPEIRAYEVGVDVVGGPTSYQVGLHSTFDDVEALERYRAHHAHQAVLQLIAEVSTHRVAVDWFDHT